MVHSLPAEQIVNSTNNTANIAILFKHPKF